MRGTIPGCSLDTYVVVCKWKRCLKMGNNPFQSNLFFSGRCNTACNNTGGGREHKGSGLWGGEEDMDLCRTVADGYSGCWGEKSRAA